jgi:hypothetical protein
MASTAHPFAELAKISETRAQELSLLALITRYRIKGFDARQDELNKWIERISREIGEERGDLMHYYTQIVLPNLPHSPMTDTPKNLTSETVGRIALKLVYLECADLSTIDKRVATFFKRNPGLTEQEVMSLVYHYLMPHYLEKIRTKYEEGHNKPSTETPHSS